MEQINALIPTDTDIKIAEESSRVLLSSMEEESPLILKLKNRSLTLSPHIAKLLFEILEQTKKGNALTIYPVQAKLTTQEAADILNVSRPYLIKLLNNKEIPFYRVGTHRRILLKDLLEYKKNMIKEREEVLDELTELSQELGLGYE